jgi:hypothetical protein
VVERLPTESGSLNKHAEVFHHFGLSAEVFEAEGAKSILKVLVL